MFTSVSLMQIFSSFKSFRHNFIKHVVSLLFLSPLEVIAWGVIHQRRPRKKCLFRPPHLVQHRPFGKPPPPQFTNVRIVSYVNVRNAKIFCDPHVRLRGGVGFRYGLRNANRIPFVDVRFMADPPFEVVHIGSQPPPPPLWLDVFDGWPLIIFINLRLTFICQNTHWNKYEPLSGLNNYSLLY